MFIPAMRNSVGSQSTKWNICVATRALFSMRGLHNRPAPRTPPSHKVFFTWKLMVLEFSLPRIANDYYYCSQ